MLVREACSHLRRVYSLQPGVFKKDIPLLKKNEISILTTYATNTNVINGDIKRERKKTANLLLKQ